ncbi:hypothetical protein GR28A_00193 [Vibrio phage vB_VcorM_GR28A]|nr:hypothetical protein GR28A_00193 [Vibrio phage vB_VcorM_GR28A]
MNEKILQRIMKCFELAKSANVNEAAQALKMAQKLMTKHGISEDQVKFAEFDTGLSKDHIRSKPKTYVTNLMYKIAELYQVTPYNHSPAGDKRTYAQFTGPRYNVKLAVYTFDILYALLKKARAEFIKEINGLYTPKEQKIEADTFCFSWVKTVNASCETLELCKEMRAKCDEYVQSNGIELGEAGRGLHRLGGSLEAWEGGEEAAADVRINAPVEDGRETLLLN